MRVKIIDASALGALVFGEPKAAKIAGMLAETPIVAPALLWFELASICLKKMKAHPQQTDQILRAFTLSRRLPIEIIGVEHSEVIALAGDTGLSTYDASYLWLEQSLGGELVTLDREMLETAARLEHPKAALRNPRSAVLNA